MTSWDFNQSLALSEAETVCLQFYIVKLNLSSQMLVCKLKEREV